MSQRGSRRMRAHSFEILVIDGTAGTRENIGTLLECIRDRIVQNLEQTDRGSAQVVVVDDGIFVVIAIAAK